MESNAFKISCGGIDIANFVFTISKTRETEL